MHVFVTGATGWVGSAIVDDMIAAGHEVTGLARSAQKAVSLARAGAHVVLGTVDDVDVLRSAATACDAVIHTAFDHDFSRFAASAEQDRLAIEALGGALKRSGRPLIVTSGLSGLRKDAVETDAPSPSSPRRSEAAANSLSEQGVHVATVRLAPSVHGAGDHGFVPILIRLAREKNVSAYIGDGRNCWSAVRREDAARVYRLALETGATERVYHAVAENSLPFRDIAEAIGRRIGVRAVSSDRRHFGWFAGMAGADMSASSRLTQDVLGWKPAGPELIPCLDHPSYYID